MTATPPARDVYKRQVGTVRVIILGRKGQGIRQQKLDTGGSIESQVGRVTVADGTRTRIIAGNQVYSAIQTDAVRQLQRAVYPLSLIHI